MKNKVAVLLATYNGEKFLREQLQSIIFQSHTDWHLFIRDDGSTDCTVEILSEFESKFDNITIVSNICEYTGSAAGNFFKLIHFSEFEGFDFISFADQDDVWSPDKLINAIEALRSNTASGYSSNLVSYDNIRKNANYIDKSQPQKAYDYLFQGASAGCTYVVTREVLLLVKKETLKIDSYKGRSHDWLIYAICRVNNIPWFFDECAHIFYRQHAGNVWGAKSAISGLINKFKILRSGWYRDNVRWVALHSNAALKNPVLIQRLNRCNLQDKIHLCIMVSQFRRNKRESILLMFILFFLF